MRPIKFRGLTFGDKTVYGFYLYEKALDCHCIVDEDGEEWLVKGNSVAQLVGRDINGNEVYEGDVLIHASGEEWTAALGSYARNSAGLATYNFKKLTLKEAKS